MTPHPVHLTRRSLNKVHCSAVALLLAASLLSGCGAVVVPPGAAPRSASAMPVQQQHPSLPVIGADARGLVRLFGEPRLDIQDPGARKLQFGDGRCVLDTYLYPARARGEPVVAYAEARRPDGEDMDWVACANQLRGR